MQIFLVVLMLVDGEENVPVEHSTHHLKVHQKQWMVLEIPAQRLKKGGGGEDYDD